MPRYSASSIGGRVPVPWDMKPSTSFREMPGVGEGPRGRLVVQLVGRLVVDAAAVRQGGSDDRNLPAHPDPSLPFDVGT